MHGGGGIALGADQAHTGSIGWGGGRGGVTSFQPAVGLTLSASRKNVFGNETRWLEGTSRTEEIHLENFVFDAS